MATYAVIGATGACGGSIVEVLLQSPDKKIRAFVRSKKKLLGQKPELETSPNVSIYEGQLKEINLLTEFISGTNAVFLAAGATNNIPGCDVARELNKSVVAALETIRQKDPQARLPQLIILSSASLEKDLMKDFPHFAHGILSKAAGYIYADLRLAEEYLRSHEWIKQVYIKPGGLVLDSPKGHILSTERQQTFLSYADLAAGMVEVADADDDKWDLKNVSVLPAAPGTRVEWRIPYFFLVGMLYWYLPFTYTYLSPYLS